MFLVMKQAFNKDSAAFWPHGRNTVLSRNKLHLIEQAEPEIPAVYLSDEHWSCGSGIGRREPFYVNLFASLGAPSFEGIA